MSILGYAPLLFKGNGGAVGATTFDPLNKGVSITLSAGNLRVTRASSGINYNSVYSLASHGHSSGQYYSEITATALGANTSNNSFGFGTSAAVSPFASNTSYVGANAFGWAYWFANGCYHNNVSSGPTTNWVNGDVLMMAVDITAGKAWWGKNGTWFASGNPSTGANPIFTGVTGIVYPMLTMFDNVSQMTANFGATAYAFTPPVGFGNW